MPEKFCSEYNKFKVTWFLSQNNFPNTSSEHFQCSIDNIAEITVKNEKSLRPESENRNKNTQFFGKRLPNNIFYTWRMCFWQNDRNVLTKYKKNYASNSDQKEKKILPQNKFP